MNSITTQPLSPVLPKMFRNAEIVLYIDAEVSDISSQNRVGYQTHEDQSDSDPTKSNTIKARPVP